MFIEEFDVLLEEELYGPVYKVVLLLERKGKGKYLHGAVSSGSTLHSTSLADLLNQTPSQLLWEAINA